MSYRPNPIKLCFHKTRRFIAKRWLSFMSAKQIGITGSQGKTNTSSSLFHLLSGLAPTVLTDLNLDTLYNVPITALKVMPWTKYAIFELGVDRPGEMDTHLEIVKPVIGIITGISPVHTDKEHMGSLENLLKEKRKLIEELPKDGLALLNGDDENVRAMVSFTKARVLFFGKEKNNDLRATDISLSLRGISFTIHTKEDVFQVSSPLLGIHHVYNILASYAVYRELGYKDLSRFQSLISQLKPLPGRMSLEKGPLDCVLLNDSLRANPASTASGLQTLSQIMTKGRKIAVLAEMGELEHPEKEHAEIGRLIAALKIDYIVAIGRLHQATKQEALKNGFPSEKFIYAEHVIMAAHELKKILQKDDLVYLKGSLLRHVERVLMVLNGEEVGCTAITCPFYHHCPVCKYKRIGYSV